MPETIAYDKPVVDFIAGLDATGHVTHTQHTKQSVTFHHNAGNLSLQGILDVWTTREASAHFQVDALAQVGQYVRVNEYAWAVGVTLGNQVSISIEMANLTMSPNWEVREVTWREGARLCGWLHSHIIGTRPTRETVLVHKDWKATVCAGPHIDTVLNTMVADAQTWYDYFEAQVAPPPPPPPPPPPDPVIPWPIPEPVLPPLPDLSLPGEPPPLAVPGVSTLTEVAQQVIDGRWGGVTERTTRLRQLGWNAQDVRREMVELLSGTGQLRMLRRRQTRLR